MLRVDNTEHTQPSLFMTIPALPNDGIHAKDIEVCLWLLFNVFRVNAILETESALNTSLKRQLACNYNRVDQQLLPIHL